MTREEAIEFGNMWLEINEDCKGSDTYTFFQMAIKALKQEPCKEGHWIKTGDYFPGDYENIDYFKCSCCHADSLEQGDYCPNCGVKMVCTFY